MAAIPPVLVNSIDLARVLDLVGLADGMTEREGIHGLVLRGTELLLILRDIVDSKIPYLDTTQIHLEEAVAQMLGAEAA